MADYSSGCYTNRSLPSRVAMIADYVKEYRADGFLVHSVKSCNSFSAGQLTLLREVELKPEIVQFVNSCMGQDRAVWGTNGLPWKENLAQIDQLGLRPEAKRKLLRDNAVELFKL